MQPNDDKKRNLQVPPSRNGSMPLSRTGDRDAAAKLMREQIDRIYDSSDAASSAPDIEATSSGPYDRTHGSPTTTNHDWQHYHSSWQKYYQQYYERYYVQQLHSSQKRAQNHVTSTQPRANLTPDYPTMVTAGKPEAPLITKNQAVHEIRDELITGVQAQTTRARNSRHFLPIISAILVALVFMLLQYNRVIVAQVKAYVSPGAVSSQNIILDPTLDTKVGSEPKLIIPKINVDAPVVYGVNSLQDAPVQRALNDGVVHYPLPGADSTPGQQGNTVILGHSSNDVFDNGAYKFVFVQLDRLNEGDTFYINHEGTRYTYSVTGKEIIDPTEINKLILDTDKPMATLVTCTPPGTALKRLVIYAEQISPDPSAASENTRSRDTNEPATIPGNSPTLFERLFN